MIQSGQAAKRAKQEVAQWFAVTRTGTAFLAGDGKVVQLGESEASSLRDHAETEAVRIAVALETRIWIAIGVVIAVVMASQTLAAALPPPFDQIVRAIAYALYSGHAIWLLYEAIKSAQATKAIRHEIAKSLIGRVPLNPALAGELGRKNPIPAILIGVGLLIFVANIAAETLSHGGIDVISAIPPWLVLSVMAFIVVLGLGNRWIDRSHGVGVLRGEGGARPS